MLRFQKTIAVRVGMVFIALGMVFAQASNRTDGQVQRAFVGDVTTFVEGGGVGVEIKTEGPIRAPQITRLGDPERIVLDFMDATPRLGFSIKKIDQGPVSRVRTALFDTDSAGRSVTRVVIDLRKKSEFSSHAEAGRFVVFISSSRRISNQTGSQKPSGGRSVSSTAESQSSVHRPAKTGLGTNKLEDIRISPSEDNTRVVLSFEQPAIFSVMSLGTPARFVLDFPGTEIAEKGDIRPRLRVNSGTLQSIRSAMFSEEPPMLRVVFDQLTNVSPRISAEGGNLILEFPTGRTNRTRAVKRAPVEPQRGLVPSRTETTAKADMNERPPEEVRPLNTASTQTETAPMKGITPNPPIVKFENGLLSVDADNSMLTDVLYAISEKTGATIQLPFSDGMLDRVVIKIGPTTPRMVLSTLLEGTAYNYYLVEGSDGRLEKVLLTPK